MVNETSTHDAYQQALDYLYSFINFELKPADRYHASKMDLERPQQLLAGLGDPHRQFPALHIAGTKGKGSVAAMCAAALRAAGLRVGLYTSPHLREFRERIRIVEPGSGNGYISEAQFVTLMERVKPLVAQMPAITWFEIVTAIAFAHFAQEAVDAAVIEVGLGGRLDATNVLQPLVSVITSLSLDHTNLLGDTLAGIAFEKGGIIKQGTPLVVAPQPPEAMAVLRDLAQQRSSPMTVVGVDWQHESAQGALTVTAAPATAGLTLPARFSVALPGAHQLENAAVALAALNVVQSSFSSISVAAMAEGLANVRWPGRLEMVDRGHGRPNFLVDCAHNADSADKLAEALDTDFSYERLWLIFGAPTDKAIPHMMARLFPLAAGVIVAAADHPRAAPPAELAAQARALGLDVAVADTIPDALRQAYALAADGDLICATGSIIFVGDLLNHWDDLQSELLAQRGISYAT